MSAFCDKTFPSLRAAFKRVKSNVPILVTITPSFECCASDDTDIIEANFRAIRAELEKLGIKERAPINGEASPHQFYVRATKSQLETLAKCPQVQGFGLAA
jgi:hypothetical protein